MHTEVSCAGSKMNIPVKWFQLLFRYKVDEY